MDAPGPSLADVSLTVASGELVVVVGCVASGKSTLAAGIFGLVRKVKGEVLTVGACAYVQQHPQILNASVRDNVTFGSAFDEERFSRSIRSCCLEADLEQFVDREWTEIGEKGITVSGGQRSRVALARALYSGASFAVLDDPLAAMDANIGHRVFQQCIVSDMCGRGTAVVLFTNQVHLGKFASRILLLDDGEVKECGTFHELMLAGGAFARLYASQEPDAEEPTAVDHGVGHVSKAPPPPLPSSSVTEKPVAQTQPAASPTPHGSMSVERHQEGLIGLKDIFRLSGTGRSRGCGAVLTVCIVCAPLSSFAANVFLNAWVVESIGTEPLQQRFQLTVYLSAGALFAALSFGRVTAASVYFVRMSTRLHELMIASVLRQKMAWYDTTPLGRILNRCSQDVMLVDQQLPRFMEFCAQYVGVVFVGVCGAAVLVWPSLVLTIPMFVFLYVVLQHYGTLAVDLQRLMLERTSPVISEVTSFLTAMDTVRAFGKVDVFKDEFCQATGRFICVYYWMHINDRVCSFFMVAVFTPLVSLILGLWRCHDPNKHQAFCVFGRQFFVCLKRQ